VRGVPRFQEVSMRGHVQADLMEARRRTALHCRVKSRGVVDRDYLVPAAPAFRSEDEHAEMLPSGGALGWALAVLAGLMATAAVTWSGWWPRVAGLLR